MVLPMALYKNYRKSSIRNNFVKKRSGEPDAVIKRATFGSRATGSRPLTQPLIPDLRHSFGMLYFANDADK